MADIVLHAELIYDGDGVPDDFVYLYVNPAFREVTGLSSVEGRRATDFVPELRIFSTPTLMIYDRVLRTGRAERFETFLPSLKRWYSAQVFRVDDRHFLLLLSEATERKNAEQALARTQVLLKEARGLARIGCWQFDPTTMDFTHTEGMHELLELNEDEAADQYSYATQMHPEDRAAADAAFGEALKSHAPFAFRHRVVGRDGRIRHFQVKGRIDSSEDGAVRLIGTTQDLTELILRKQALRESEQRLQATIEVSPVPLALGDMHGRVVYLNAAFRNTFGYEITDIPTLDHWWSLAYPDPAYRLCVQQDWHSRLTEARASGKPVRSGEAVIRTKNGSSRICVSTATWVGSASDGLHLTTLYDITERKNLEERLRKQSAHLHNVIDEIPYALAMFDTDHRLIGINQQFHELHRIGPEAQFLPEKTTFDDMIRYFHARGDYPGMLENALVPAFAELVERGERFHFEPQTIHGRIVEIDGIPLESGSILLSYKDVTDSTRHLNEARAAALHDPLTLLPNRRALEAHFDAMTARRPADQMLTALLLIDLDRFKALNDSLGHIYGDLLLAEVANRLNRRIRSSDLVARLGGDEFVVLLGDLPNRHEDARRITERIAEDIRAALSTPYHLRPVGQDDGAGDRVYACSASIGGWILPNDADNLTSAIGMADKALYQSKSRGRDAAIIY